MKPVGCRRKQQYDVVFVDQVSVVVPLLRMLTSAKVRHIHHMTHICHAPISAEDFCHSEHAQAPHLQPITLP